MATLMKGKVFAERKHTVVYPCIAEVKYDEIRVHVRYFNNTAPGGVEHVQFMSYDGKPLHNLGLYSQQFLSFFRESGLTELDMGLEVNGNFNDSYRWARSSSGIPQEKLDKKTGKVAPALDHSMVKFYLFDIPESKLEFFDEEKNDRRTERMHAVNSLTNGHGLRVSLPLLRHVGNEEQLHMIFRDMRERGYEGLMVKSYDHTYQKGKRIDGWLKMKPEAEADGEIVGMTEAISEDGTPLGRAGSITLRIHHEDDTFSFASPHGIAHELGTLMWLHPEKYIGQWAQFNYMERDRQGGYRHPTFGRLRESK